MSSFLNAFNYCIVLFYVTVTTRYESDTSPITTETTCCTTTSTTDIIWGLTCEGFEKLRYIWIYAEKKKLSASIRRWALAHEIAEELDDLVDGDCVSIRSLSGGSASVNPLICGRVVVNPERGCLTQSDDTESEVVVAVEIDVIASRPMAFKRRTRRPVLIRTIHFDPRDILSAIQSSKVRERVKGLH